MKTTNGTLDDERDEMNQDMNERFVYVVTRCDGDECCICAVYDNLAIAKRHIKLWGDEDYNDIEIWKVNGFAPMLLSGMLPYRIIMWRDGYVEDVIMADPTDIPIDNAYSSEENVTWPLYDIWPAPFEVWARDPEHAIKIANERRLQLIATNKWPGPDSKD